MAQGCIEWSGPVNQSGYGRRRIGNGRRALAHRVAFEEVNGPIPDGLIIRHKCDNRLCVNPDHLELGTRLDNTQDMLDRGRSLYGEKHPGHRLTDDEVRAIYADPDPDKVVAARYGVHRGTVSKIKNGTRRVHATGATARSNPNIKLTADDVRAIRATTGLSQWDIAARYGITQAQVWRILKGISWPNV